MKATLGGGPFGHKEPICALPRLRVSDIGAFTSADFASKLKVLFWPKGVGVCQ